jgi:hypothetical protein
MSIDFETVNNDSDDNECFPPCASDEEMEKGNDNGTSGNDTTLNGQVYQTVMAGVDNHTVMQFVLLQLLSRIRAPRYAYNEMKQWCQLAANNGFDFSQLSS